MATLRDEIISKCSVELIASADYDAIAAQVSADRFVSTGLVIGNGTIIETLGIDEGNLFLDVIYSAPAYRHVKPLMEQGRLVVSSPVVRAAIQAMVPGVISQASADKLLALGVEAAPVTSHECAAALANS